MYKRESGAYVCGILYTAPHSGAMVMIDCGKMMFGQLSSLRWVISSPDHASVSLTRSQETVPDPEADESDAPPHSKYFVTILG
jgi:hypothetical protein